MKNNMWMGNFCQAKRLAKKQHSLCLKRKRFNSCILTAMTYGCDTWSLTKKQQNQLAATQRKMERSMLNVTVRDKKRNDRIRNQTIVYDIIKSARLKKGT